MQREIAFINVSYIKENNDSRVEILDKISLDIPTESIYTIVGPSGSGKSSLLQLVNRLSEVTEGEIFIGKKEIKEFDVIELRRKVGLVFQNPILFPGTVKDNILYGPKLIGNDKKSLAREIIEIVGLSEEFLYRDVEDLSGGEKQRVAIARAIANEPDILLLDEPTSALDPKATTEIEKLILSLNSKLGITVVWVTHDMEQAKRVGNHTMLLIRGKKVEEANTADFFSNPKTNEAKEFIKFKERAV